MPLYATHIYFPEQNSKKRALLPFSVPAGQPKTTAETEIAWMDLNQHLCRKENGTVYVYIEGDSMIDEEIYDGDIAVVDRVVEPIPGDIIIARIGDEYTIKTYKRKAGHLYLVPANNNYKQRKLTKSDDFEIFGVVTWTIHKRR